MVSLADQLLLCADIKTFKDFKRHYIMKYIILVFAVAFTLSSCSSNSDKSNDSLDTIAVVQPRTPLKHALCFLRSEGRDSTSIELVIKDNKVTGLMNWLPYEKDSRKGKLAGTINNDTIEVVWSFMQEGMTDTLMLHFKLDDTRLWQKPLKLNTQTGREQTDAASDYSLAYATADKIYK